MSTTRAPLVLLSLLALACDDTGVACTEIGCSSLATIHVVDEADAPVPGLFGTVTIDGTTYNVDCRDGGASDDNVSCADDAIRVTLPQDTGGGEIVLDLATDGGITATATLDAVWDTEQPNGEDCPPTCYTTEAGVAIDDV